MPHLFIDDFARIVGPWAPVGLAGLFLAASFLMIWRLESLSSQGFEGTVLGTLVMPYCSGIGNLVFALLMGRGGGPASEVAVNCLVNNVTNLTLLIGLPALIWGLELRSEIDGSSRARRKSKPRANSPSVAAPTLQRLSILFTLVAVLFFTGTAWALTRDRRLGFEDGLVLIGLFAFWQTVHVFEVLKTNARDGRSLGLMMVVDLALLLFAGWVVYGSIDWLLQWVSKGGGGWVNSNHLGWLSGWLMVLPNGVMAIYYAWRRRPDIAYSSQVGDAHICIPLCLGIAALLTPYQVPRIFDAGLQILAAAALFHMACLLLFGRLPRWTGWLLLGAYGAFLSLGF